MLAIRRGAAITASLALVALWMPIAPAQPLARVAAVAQGLPRFGGCKTFFSRSVSGLVRSRSIMLACGDGNFYLTRIAWTRWGMRQALGIGVGHQNDCIPDCASGHFHTYRVSVRLDHAMMNCGTQKLAQFTRASYVFIGEKPRAVARSGSESFRCR